MVVVYGIPNCDNVKKTISWLKAKRIAFELYDYKKEGAPPAQLKRWCAVKGWETIFNKRSTTWKELLASGVAGVTNGKEALAVMTKHTSIIKRPILEAGDEIIVGFNENEYIQQLIKK